MVFNSLGKNSGREGGREGGREECGVERERGAGGGGRNMHINIAIDMMRTMKGAELKGIKHDDSYKVDDGDGWDFALIPPSFPFIQNLSFSFSLPSFFLLIDFDFDFFRHDMDRPACLFLVCGVMVVAFVAPISSLLSLSLLPLSRPSISSLLSSSLSLSRHPLPLILDSRIQTHISWLCPSSSTLSPSSSIFIALLSRYK